MRQEGLILQLNADTKEKRLDAVTSLKGLLNDGQIPIPMREGFTNNHVHTMYSFSPYSPAKAVWMAYMSGLSTVGIVDHDAVGGAEEFIAAGEILGIATTVGFEVRTDWSDTPLNGRRINNPDQLTNSYICAHGLPHTQIGKTDVFLSSIRAARHKRNRAMMQRLNALMSPHGIALDYDTDVLPASFAAYGGEVTERHLMYALAHKMIQRFGKGQALVAFIENALNMSLSETQRNHLSDTQCEIYDYDLLNILKSSFVSRIYIDSVPEETPPVSDVVEFIKSVGAIPTYCYLGDVAASPTGDKKAQKFEDDHLEDVFSACRQIGFTAIAYMPSRNTPAQLERVMAICDRESFLQISGEDINQPRQSFICRQLAEEKFAHLSDTAWALVGHEKAATADLNNVMLKNETGLNPRQLQLLIDKYKRIGMDDNITINR
jgi:hypothetical protein